MEMFYYLLPSFSVNHISDIIIEYSYEFTDEREEAHRDLRDQTMESLGVVDIDEDGMWITDDGERLDPDMYKVCNIDLHEQTLSVIYRSLV